MPIIQLAEESKLNLIRSIKNKNLKNYNVTTQVSTTGHYVVVRYSIQNELEYIFAWYKKFTVTQKHRHKHQTL